jgi:hypothetical protein
MATLLLRDGHSSAAYHVGQLILGISLVNQVIDVLAGFPVPDTLLMNRLD